MGISSKDGGGHWRVDKHRSDRDFQLHLDPYNLATSTSISSKYPVYNANPTNEELDEPLAGPMTVIDSHEPYRVANMSLSTAQNTLGFSPYVHRASQSPPKRRSRSPVGAGPGYLRQTVSISGKAAIGQLRPAGGVRPIQAPKYLPVLTDISVKERFGRTPSPHQVPRIVGRPKQQGVSPNMNPAQPYSDRGFAFGEGEGAEQMGGTGSPRWPNRQTNVRHVYVKRTQGLGVGDGSEQLAPTTEVKEGNGISIVTLNGPE